MRYLARSLSLGTASCGNDEMVSICQAYEEMLEGCVEDIRSQWSKLCYGGEREKNTPAFLKSLQAKFEPFTAWFTASQRFNKANEGDSRLWLGGNQLC